MAKFSVCKYQSYQRKVEDNTDNPKVYCKKTKDICGAQKYCPELNKFVISERAKMICKYFEDAFKK